MVNQKLDVSDQLLSVLMTWNVKVVFVRTESVKSFVGTLMIALLVKDVYKTNVKFHALDILNVCRHKHA